MEDKSNNFGDKVSSSFKKWNRPKFLGGQSEGGDAPAGLKTDDKKSSAAAGLKSAEKGATGANLSQAEDNLSGARKTEEQATGLYSGTGRGIDAKDGDEKKDFKGKITKGGPIAAILVAVLSVGGIMSGAQSFQLFSYVANTNINYGQSSAILRLRAKYDLRRALTDDPNRTSITNIFGKEKYKIGAELKQKLKANNIDVVETDGTDGKSLRMLVWTDQSGEKIPIVVSGDDIDRIPNSYTSDTGEVSLAKTRYTLDAAEATLKSFKTDLDTSTINITGKTAGWFDSLADVFLKRIGGDDVRNKLRKLSNNSSEEEVDEVLYKNSSDGSDDSNISKVKDLETEVDSDGNEITKEVPATDADFAEGDNNGNDSLKVGDTDVQKIESKLKTTVKKTAVGGSVACMVLKGIGAINAVVAGVQVANVINNTLKILEASDSVRAGDGNNSFNIIANSLNEPARTVAYDSDGNEVILEGSTTSSDGWNNAFSSKNIVSENDPGALTVNRELATKTALRRSDFAGVADWGQILGEVGTSVTAFGICNGIQLALGVSDLIGDIVLFFTTAGIGSAVKKFFGGVIEGIKVTATITALGAAIGVIAPIVGRWLSGNLENVFRGKIGGYALDSGTHIIHDGNLQMSAGMNMNKEQTLELYAKTREVEKEWAAYDRATLSPFDISSKYTFMGSLATAAIPLINSSYSLTSSMSSSMNMLGDSIAKLTGESVNAVNDLYARKLSFSSDENCASLTNMGIAGDAYCNKYSGAYTDDLTTMTSYEIYDKVQECFDGEDSNGNPIIKPDSDCAKYIIACNTNDAQPGTMSAVVEGYITQVTNKVSGGTVAGNTLVGFASNFIPFEGAIDAFQAIEEQNNIKWNSQKVCSDPTYRYISDYFVDQRVLENLGIIESSSVSVFLNDYYKENPIDNSYEGTIARYSGLSKEEVEDTLALIEYVNYVANYDPSERYAFGAPAVETEENLNLENEYRLASAPVLLNEIVYADVRNRSFAV